MRLPIYFFNRSCRMAGTKGISIWAGILLSAVAFAQAVPDWNSLPEFTTEGPARLVCSGQSTSGGSDSIASARR
jgi:hypothetical protein